MINKTNIKKKNNSGSDKMFTYQYDIDNNHYDNSIMAVNLSNEWRKLIKD